MEHASLTCCIQMSCTAQKSHMLHQSLASVGLNMQIKDILYLVHKSRYMCFQESTYNVRALLILDKMHEHTNYGVATYTVNRERFAGVNFRRFHPM